jgi:Glycosyl hydrolases family 16
MLKNFSLLIACLLFMTIGSLASAQGSQHGKVSWGTPDQPWGTRRPVTAADQKLIAGYRSGKWPTTFQSDFSNLPQFQKDWQPQSDDKAGLPSCRRPENVQSTSQGLLLKTLAAHDCKVQWSTGAVISTVRQKYGFFEARMKVADITGMNNAFWLTTQEQHGYEIDVAEAHFPGYDHLNLCNWAPSENHHTVGFGLNFTSDLSKDFHDYGVLWTPTWLIYEVDGEALAAVDTHDAIPIAVNLRFSSALVDFAGKLTTYPVGHNMLVRSVRVVAYRQ